MVYKSKSYCMGFTKVLIGSGTFFGLDSKTIEKNFELDQTGTRVVVVLINLVTFFSHFIYMISYIKRTIN